MKNQIVLKSFAVMLALGGSVGNLLGVDRLPKKASISYVGEAEIDVFDKDRRIFLDQVFVVSECPKPLRGKQFLKRPINTAQFRVIESGELIILAPDDELGKGYIPFPERSQFRDLEAKLDNGFNRLDIAPFILFVDDEPRRVAVYSVMVTEGQHYRFGKHVVVLGFEDAVRDDPLPWNENKGEVLYNGIRLPSVWPPTDIGYSIAPAEKDPMPVPYLVHPPEVIPIDVGRQLLFDDFLIAETDLNRVFHTPVKYVGNPVLKPETAMEVNADGKTSAAVAVPKSGGVHWDSEEGVFKMWYEAGWFGTIAYATSKDGVNWQRPEFDIVPGTNQVLPTDLVPDSWTVVRNWDSANPEEKWTMYMQPPIGGAGTGWSLTSPDGVHWNRRTPTGIAGDRSTHFYNPFRKKWVYSLRVSRREGVMNRARLYHECDDFMEGASWSAGDVVDWSTTDRDDPIDYLTREKPQLYNLDAVAYESVMLSFFQILQGPANEDSKAAGLPKITELMFAYSRDGFHWHRPDRRAHIQATRSNAWDRGYVQSVGNLCVIRGDKLWFYYIGFQGDESKAGGEGLYDRGATGVAFLRRDGFASLDAGPTPGTLTTKPLTFSGNFLFVNANVANGRLRAEIRDADGRPIPPFTIENSIPFVGDSTLTQLKWKGGDNLSVLGGRPVSIHFEVTNGSLYAFWVSPTQNGQSNGYVAGGGPGYIGPTDTVGKKALEAHKVNYESF